MLQRQAQKQSKKQGIHVSKYDWTLYLKKKKSFCQISLSPNLYFLVCLTDLLKKNASCRIMCGDLCPEIPSKANRTASFSFSYKENNFQMNSTPRNLVFSHINDTVIHTYITTCINVFIIESIFEGFNLCMGTDIFVFVLDES